MKELRTAFISSLFTMLVMSGIFIYLSKSEDVSAQVTGGDVVDFTEQKNDYKVVNTRESANDEIFGSRSNVITRTVSNVSPAVVGINVTEIRQYRDPLSNDPFFRRFFGDRVYNRKVKGLGSGSIISPDGYIITNDHVAGNATKIIVTMTDGTRYDARLVGTDPVSDICLLKIEAEDLPYIKLGKSDDILIGEWVIALGNPFGLFSLNDKPTVTVGVVSALGMNLGEVNERYYLSMIQTDAAINGGNSGGPLVNAIGELIGMNTLIYTAQGSSGNVGVGFAIPINKVKSIIDELKQNGSVTRDFWTGLRIQSIDEEIARYYGLPNTHGVIVTYIGNDSPADKAGLEVGDVILKVEKYVINDDETLIGVLQDFRTGDNIELTVFRNGDTLTKEMELEKL
ncbi:MAG: hypothetical protein SCALA702_23020 [Melioribacteraceae bacterium]|nr:MAG: hypothetical protein SCALA702_23020 [Melioribacteraceae bacterium]